MDATEDREVLDTALTLIHSRQHVSPKRLGEPGPDREQMAKILGAACAGLSSGKALYSRRMRKLFRLAADEQPLCFMTVGTVLRRKPPRPRPTTGDYTSTL